VKDDKFEKIYFSGCDVVVNSKAGAFMIPSSAHTQDWSKAASLGNNKPVVLHYKNSGDPNSAYASKNVIWHHLIGANSDFNINDAYKVKFHIYRFNEGLYFRPEHDNFYVNLEERLQDKFSTRITVNSTDYDNGEGVVSYYISDGVEDEVTMMDISSMQNAMMKFDFEDFIQDYSRETGDVEIDDDIYGEYIPDIHYMVGNYLFTFNGSGAKEDVHAFGYMLSNYAQDAIDMFKSKERLRIGVIGTKETRVIKSDRYVERTQFKYENGQVTSVKIKEKAIVSPPKRTTTRDVVSIEEYAVKA